MLDKRAIIETYLAGNSLHQTARLLGTTHSWVYKVVKAAGIKREYRRTRPINPENIKYLPPYVQHILHLSRGHSPTKLARRAGIGDDMLYRYYNGQRVPSAAVVEWLAEAMGYRITVEKIDASSREEKDLGISAGLAQDHLHPSGDGDSA